MRPTPGDRMKLAASLIVKDELGRYLDPCINHLLEFVDEIRVVDDHSGDGSWEWLLAQGERVQPLRVGDEPGFFAHEGRARQALLDWTLAGHPTHVLAIDADEFVADGPALRRTLERHQDRAVWWLQMEEIWEASSAGLCVREDGGWIAHGVPALWRVPARTDAMWRIRDRALACGRVPVAIDGVAVSAAAVTELLHFGWANEAERDGRYQRYAVADGGRFHASQHLQSILWPCERVRLRPRGWPEGLADYQTPIVRRTGTLMAA